MFEAQLLQFERDLLQSLSPVPEAGAEPLRPPITAETPPREPVRQAYKVGAV